jgi:hypothetical protein
MEKDKDKFEIITEDENQKQSQQEQAPIDEASDTDDAPKTCKRKIVQYPGLPPIIELRPNNVALGLRELADMAEHGEIDCVLVAAFTPDNEIITLKSDMDMFDHQHLVSIMNVDMTISTIMQTTVYVK